MSPDQIWPDIIWADKICIYIGIEVTIDPLTSFLKYGHI